MTDLWLPPISPFLETSPARDGALPAWLPARQGSSLLPTQPVYKLPALAERG